MPITSLKRMEQKIAAAFGSTFSQSFLLLPEIWQAHYVKTAERSSFEQANHALIDIHNQLRIEDLNLCADHEKLLNAAKRFAEKCYLARHRTENITGSLSSLFTYR
jgi:hypothetical protein